MGGLSIETFDVFQTRDHSISFWTRIQEIMGEKLRVKGCGHYSRLNCPSGDKRNFKGR